MAQRPTLDDLAAASQVSLSTLDRIVNRRGSVKRATIEQVLKAAERIGYHGLPSIRQRLLEDAPPRSFGFLLNHADRGLYAQLADRLAERARGSQVVRGRAVVRHLATLDPAEMAAALRELGGECDAIGGVLTDHPLVHDAVEELAAKGVPVWALFSDLSKARAGFIGADPTRMGRSAGWFIRNLCADGGKVALLTGSHSYHAHCRYESGLRGFLEESGSRFRVLPAAETLERDERAREVMAELISAHPDMVALVVAGGGMEGAVAALSPEQRRRLTVVGTELSIAMDRCLAAGEVDAVLSHPVDQVVEELVSRMEGQHFGDAVVPIEIRIRESF